MKTEAEQILGDLPEHAESLPKDEG